MQREQQDSRAQQWPQLRSGGERDPSRCRAHITQQPLCIATYSTLLRQRPRNPKNHIRICVRQLKHADIESRKATKYAKYSRFSAKVKKKVNEILYAFTLISVYCKLFNFRLNNEWAELISNVSF